MNQPLQKHQFPREPSSTPSRRTQRFLEQCKAERERWIGSEHTKAYRFRNAGNRYRVRGW